MSDDPKRRRLIEEYVQADKFPVPRGANGQPAAITAIECHDVTSAWFKEAGPDYDGKEWKRVSDMTANYPSGTFAANGGIIIAKDHNNVPFIILDSEENADALKRAGFERDQRMRVVGSTGEQFQNPATLDALRRFEDIRRNRVPAKEAPAPVAGAPAFQK